MFTNASEITTSYTCLIMCMSCCCLFIKMLVKRMCDIWKPHYFLIDKKVNETVKQKIFRPHVVLEWKTLSSSYLSTWCSYVIRYTCQNKQSLNDCKEKNPRKFVVKALKTFHFYTVI